MVRVAAPVNFMISVLLVQIRAALNPIHPMHPDHRKLPGPRKCLLRMMDSMNLLREFLFGRLPLLGTLQVVFSQVEVCPISAVTVTVHNLGQ